MINKERVYNPDTSRNGGSRAIKLSNVSEWLIFAGHAAIDKEERILFPGDAIAQIRWVWGSLKKVLEQEGYGLGDVIQLQMTCTNDVSEDQRVQFLKIAGEVFGHLEIPPVGSTMKVVHALALPGMLVEVDIWAAK